MGRQGAAALAATVAIAASAPAAGAVERNAVAQGGAGSGECTTTPCTFAAALTAAAPGDEVVVHPGDHQVPSTPASPLTVNKQLFIHGIEGAPRPRLIHSSGGVGSFIPLTAVGIRLRHLQIESGAGGGTSNQTLHVTNSAVLERLVVVKAGANTYAALLLELGGTTVRDTVARTTGDGPESPSTRRATRSCATSPPSRPAPEAGESASRPATTATGSPRAIRRMRARAPRGTSSLAVARRTCTRTPRAIAPRR